MYGKAKEENTMEAYEQAIELVQSWYDIDRNCVIHYFWDEVIAALCLIS